MKTKESKTTAKGMRAQLPLSHALLIVTAATLTFAAVAFPHLPLVHERQMASLSLDQLQEKARSDGSFSGDPVSLYYLGKGLNQAGRFADAVPLLEQAAGLDPAAARVRDEWARALVGTGRPSEAFAQLMQFVGANPGSAEAYVVIGRFHVAQKAYGAARPALEKAVALDARDATAWSLLANCRIGMGDTTGGEDALAHALALRPGGADAAPDWLQQASLQAGRQPEAAQAAFQKSVQLAPGNAEAHREFARFLIAQGSFPQAEQEARAALALRPDDAQSSYLLGKALVASAAPQEAIASLEKAARLAADDPMPAAELRRAYLKLKEPTKAAFWQQEQGRRDKISTELKLVTDQIRARPNDRAARRHMAQLLAQTGDIPGCVRETALSLSVKPDSPRALVAAGRTLDQADRSEAALPLVRQGLAGMGSVAPEVTEFLGDLLLKVGRLHEAAVQYQSISDLRPQRVAQYQRQIAQAAAHLRAQPSPADRRLAQAEAALARGDSAAIDLARQAVAAEPDNTRALRFCLQQEFAARRDPAQRDAARLTANRLASVSPEDGISRALLGVLLLEAEPGAAGDDIKQLLASAQADPGAAGAIWYARALMMQNRGDLAEARESFQRAAALDPQFIRSGTRLITATTSKGKNHE